VKSIYRRQFMVMVSVVLLSFLLLGTAVITLTYRYTVSDRTAALDRQATYIAQAASSAMTSDDNLGGFSIEAALFRPMVEAVAELGDTTLFLCLQDGTVLYSTESSMGDFTGQRVPHTVFNSITAKGSYASLTSLNGLFPSQRYVAARPILRQYLGGNYLVGMVVISADAESITQMWRTFVSTFLFAAMVVMLVAFLTSSITSLQQAKPLKTLAEAVRKFGHGEYETRVDLGARHDEVGELADAFNAMANNIAQSEAERSEFIANVSHELKTPMTTIAGFADGILDGTIPPEKEREYLATISSETRRLSRLVRRMLDLSRLQAGAQATAQERFDVGEILARTLVSLEGKINDKGLDVDTGIPDEPVQVWGDPDGITQVCYNLLDNAIKFSTPGSTLGVSITTKGGKAHVAIRNTGDTIPAEEIPLLFDRFHKSDKSRSMDREGVGLGLYIAKTILNNHRENITCTSQDGVTQFSFTLTLA